jgi:hypothetical protein
VIHVSSRDLVSCLVYSPTLNIQTKRSSETSAHFKRATHCYIPEDRSLYNHREENPKSDKERFGVCKELQQYKQTPATVTSYGHRAK